MLLAVTLENRDRLAIPALPKSRYFPWKKIKNPV